MWRWATEWVSVSYIIGTFSIYCLTHTYKSLLICHAHTLHTRTHCNEPITNPTAPTTSVWSHSAWWISLKHIFIIWSSIVCLSNILVGTNLEHLIVIPERIWFAVQFFVGFYLWLAASRARWLRNERYGYARFLGGARWYVDIRIRMIPSWCSILCCCCCCWLRALSARKLVGWLRAMPIPHVGTKRIYCGLIKEQQGCLGKFWARCCCGCCWRTMVDEWRLSTK